MGGRIFEGLSIFFLCFLGLFNVVPIYDGVPNFLKKSLPNYFYYIYYIISYYIISYYIILYYIILYHIILYYIILYCIITICILIAKCRCFSK